MDQDFFLFNLAIAAAAAGAVGTVGTVATAGGAAAAGGAATTVPMQLQDMNEHVKDLVKQLLGLHGLFDRDISLNFRTVTTRVVSNNFIHEYFGHAQKEM